MISKLADTYYTYKFLRLLTTKWEDLDAFKLGLIDKEGKRTEKEPKTEEEKSSYTYFHRLVFKLKRLVDKVPFGKSSIAKYATAVFLLKEELGIDIEYPLYTFLETNQPNFEYPTHNTDLVLRESNPNKYIRIFEHDFKLVNNELVLVEDFSTGGVDMSSSSTSKKTEDETFGGHKVFQCDTETMNNCRLGKTPYARYSKFVGNSELGNSIKEYCLKNPKKSVILKDSKSGSMLFLRRK